MSVTRREFIGAAALTSAVVLVRPSLGGTVTPACTPVVSFFMDQPYLDFTGEAQPYVPPVGLRSGQLSAQHMESLFHVC